MTTNALYLEVYQKILESIHSLEYIENTPLPSERYLSERYHVSRSTIRQALNKLKSDGFIYTVHGNGSFIKPQVIEQPLNRFYSFTDELKSMNRLIENKIIEYSMISLEPHLAKKLNHPTGSLFHKLIRLRSEKEYPLMIETSYLPKSRIHSLNVEYLNGHGSLYSYLSERYAFHANHATETFRPIIPLQHEKELLQLPSNSPCMLLERYSYEDDCIIEYTKSIIRGDKYIFKIDFPKDTGKTNSL